MGEVGATGEDGCAIGDAEMDEGNICEALLEGWKHGITNTWWVVDYNRQSLDAVIREGLWKRFEELFRGFGWDVVILKYGSLLEEAFAEPGGDRLRAWIDACPNQLYSALCFQGGAAWRRRLEDELGDQGAVSRLIAGRSDDELASLMTNLAGHDIPALLAAFEAARGHERPVCFIAYTIKGYGLPFQGHKDNHAGLMTVAQMDAWRASMGVRADHEWDRFEGLSDSEATALQALLDAAPFFQGGQRRFVAPTISIPERLEVPSAASTSTQQGFGAILAELARTKDGRPDRDLFARYSPIPRTRR